jgi:hypothetical protein
VAARCDDVAAELVGRGRAFMVLLAPSVIAISPLDLPAFRHSTGPGP